MFEYRQAQEVCDAFRRHSVRFLFIGKAGAVLLGFPDTTQDVDLYLEKSVENGERAYATVLELGFNLIASLSADIRRAKALVQLNDGPFNLDLIFAPDGIERFEDAWSRRVEMDSMPVCHLDDIIASKKASGRQKDKETLPRLLRFREYWIKKQRSP